MKNNLEQTVIRLVESHHLTIDASRLIEIASDSTPLFKQLKESDKISGLDFLRLLQAVKYIRLYLT